MVQEVVDVKVTRIHTRWHARLLVNGEVRSEMACFQRMDIGWICRELLRWHDKCGGMSSFASAARHRQKRGPYGQIWYPAQIEAKRKT